MTAAVRLSNALDKGPLDLELGLSNALDKREPGPPGPWGQPPGRREISTPEGPVLPALRRFGVPENRREDSMPRI